VEKIKPEAKLIDDLGADSLTAVEIVMELEKELGVDIDDSEVEKIVTVQDIINIVEGTK
jgi:acyl carrier protein